MELSAFREDLAKHTSGAPIYVGDACFYVRRWGTAEAQKALRDIRLGLFGPLHKHQIGDDDRIMAEWLAEYGVTGWENVRGDDGPLGYDKQAARKVFLNPEYFQSLNSLLYVEAAKFENYLHDQAAEDLDALKKP